MKINANYFMSCTDSIINMQYSFTYAFEINNYPCIHDIAFFMQFIYTTPLRY